MIILSAQDLEDYGVRQTASTITFMGKAFVRGQTFAQRLRKMAIAMAEESMERGAACLLVDFETHITVWREQKNSATSTAQRDPQRSPQSDHWIDARPNQKGKTSALKYRGQSLSKSPTSKGHDHARIIAKHDVTYRGKPVQPSQSSSESGSENPTSKPKRRMKYRGRWVEVD